MLFEVKFYCCDSYEVEADSENEAMSKAMVDHNVQRGTKWDEVTIDLIE